jgi:hypothetical protein
MSTDLHRAIKAHDLDTLARLLAAGDDPNELSAEWPGWNPLKAAINEIEDGRDVEAVAPASPLLAAVRAQVICLWPVRSGGGSQPDAGQIPRRMELHHRSDRC